MLGLSVTVTECGRHGGVAPLVSSQSVHALAGGLWGQPASLLHATGYQAQQCIMGTLVLLVHALQSAPLLNDRN